MWPSLDGDGHTSASLASQTAGQIDWNSVAPGEVAERLEAVFSLPGTPSDYHFAMLGCYDKLWKRRGEEPGFFPVIEQVCRLDVQLFDNHCDEISFGGRPLPPENERRHVRVDAYRILFRLYLEEGFLPDALDIASRASRAGQGSSFQDEVNELVQRLVGELSE